MLSWLGLFLVLQEGAAPALPEPPQAQAPSWLDPVQGSLRARFRHRASGGESDTDLYEFLSLFYGDPDKDAVTAALSARFAEDLDGNRNVQGFHPFGSLDDKYHSFATQRLYTAYLNLRSTSSGLSLRAGRQILDEFPEAVPMDGATVRYQPSTDVSLMVFGGVPVNLFESSPSGDAMYGAAAEWIPDPQRIGRYRVEYLHIRDENVFGLHRDDLVGFSLDEGADAFRLYARYTLLEGESRDLVARLSAVVPDAGFLFQVQGTYVFHRIEALSYALDPYASFLMDLQPYVDVVVRASKSFGEKVVLDASFTSRQLTRSGTESTYNHEFKRVELAPQVRPIEDLSVRVSADFWSSSGSDFWTVGGDLAWTMHRDIVLSVGTAYALYSIDVFTGDERERVRTYFVGLKWMVSKGSTIDARFSFEDSTIGNFRTLEVGFRHAF